MMDEQIYVWPDGTFCYREDLAERLKTKPATYEVMGEDEFFEQAGGDSIVRDEK